MVTSTDAPVTGSSSLPEGHYKLVGWDLDYTGRRFIDEILQVAAYTPEKQFSIYMMPCRDLTLNCRRRHKLKVVTIHRYRVLKPLTSNKPIKTKSEISGLVDFITWLEEVKGDAKDGIILVCHEQLHYCPLLLLHCLGRYPHANLLERFKAVVVGFASGFSIAETKCAKTVNQFTLKTLSTVLLGKDEALDSAAVRAHLAYQVMQQVCSEEAPDSNAGAGDAASLNTAQLVSCVREFAQPISCEEELLRQQEDIIKRQDALRPLFIPMMSTTRKERERAAAFRRTFVNANVDMNNVKEAWEAGKKDAVEKLLAEKVGINNEKDTQDVTQLVEWFYVPELRPAPEPRPKTERRPSRPRRGRRSSKQADKANGDVSNSESAENTEDKSSSPKTDKSPNVSANDSSPNASTNDSPKEEVSTVAQEAKE